MVIFNNIVIKFSDNVLIMNLISFRRKILTYDQLEKLTLIYNKINNLNTKLTDEEYMLYNSLINEKQILNQEIINNFDNEAYLLAKEEKLNFNHLENIQLNISYECNFECTYCYQKNKIDKNQKMNKEDIKKIYDLCNMYSMDDCNNSNFLVFISGGEPITESNLPLIWEIANVFKKCGLMFQTNGVNLLKMWDKLPMNQVKELKISLDGDDSIISKLSLKNRKTVAFEQIVLGIKKALKFGIDVKIASILTNDTFDFACKLLELLKKHNILSSVSITFSAVCFMQV